MILLVIISIALGFYMVYQTSRKTAVRKSKLDLWFFERPSFTKGAGVCLFVLATVLGIYYLGFGVSIFYALVALMAISSFTIILFPIYFPKNK